MSKSKPDFDSVDDILQNHPNLIRKVKFHNSKRKANFELEYNGAVFYKTYCISQQHYLFILMYYMMSPRSITGKETVLLF